MSFSVRMGGGGGADDGREGTKQLVHRSSSDELDYRCQLRNRLGGGGYRALGREAPGASGGREVEVGLAARRSFGCGLREPATPAWVISLTQGMTCLVPSVQVMHGTFDDPRTDDSVAS